MRVIRARLEHVHSASLEHVHSIKISNNASVTICLIIYVIRSHPSHKVDMSMMSAGYYKASHSRSELVTDHS